MPEFSLWAVTPEPIDPIMDALQSALADMDEKLLNGSPDFSCPVWKNLISACRFYQAVRAGKI